MFITATAMVELSGSEVEKFEEEYWSCDTHYDGMSYFMAREKGPFLVDLEGVCFETREWLEKYNTGWEGFCLFFTAAEHAQMERLAERYGQEENRRLAMTLYPDRALLYLHQQYLEAIIRELIATANAPAVPMKEKYKG